MNSQHTNYGVKDEHRLTVSKKRELFVTKIKFKIKVKAKRPGKKEYLLKKGQVCRNVYFIRSGLLYRYHMERDNMIISGVMEKNDTVYTVPGFCNQRPSHEFIRAVDPTELYYIGYNELRGIKARFPEFHFICHEIGVRCHSVSDRRSDVLHSVYMSASGQQDP